MSLFLTQFGFVVHRWKIQKLTYDERQAALVKRLNAINGEDEE